MEPGRPHGLAVAVLTAIAVVLEIRGRQQSVRQPDERQRPQMRDDVDVRRDSVWSRGLVWSAAQIGAPAGLGFGALQYASRGSLAKALLSAAFFGVFFGATMAWVTQRSWPGAKNLAPDERVAVARAVRLGEAVADPRLARGVLERATVVRKAAEQQRRRWVLWAFGGLSLLLAIRRTSQGADREAIVLWCTVALWAALLAWQPRLLARTHERASRAEADARNLLALTERSDPPPRDHLPPAAETERRDPSHPRTPSD